MSEKKKWYVQRHSHLDAKQGAFIDTEMHKSCVLIKECPSKKMADSELKKAKP